MYFAPVLMMLSAYWHLGNRQAFENEAIPKVNKNDEMNPNHPIFDTFVPENVQLYILIFFPFMLFPKVVQKIFRKFIYCLTLSVKHAFFDEEFNFDESAINENLDSYWKSISGVEQKRWYATELNKR